MPTPVRKAYNTSQQGSHSTACAYLNAAIDVSREDEAFAPHAYAVGCLTLVYTVGTNVAVIDRLYLAHSAGRGEGGGGRGGQ